MPSIYIAYTTARKFDALIIVRALDRGCLRDRRGRAREGNMSATDTFFDIEHVITDDDPITSLPWPPAEPGWEFVCRRPVDRTTVWRRFIQPKI